MAAASCKTAWRVKVVSAGWRQAEAVRAGQASMARRTGKGRAGKGCVEGRRVLQGGEQGRRQQAAACGRGAFGNERMEQEKKKEDKSIDLNLPVGFNSPAMVGGRL